MRVLVTGGCGFVGRHLVNRLVKNKLTVTVIDNLKTSYDKGPLPPHVNFVKGDILTDLDKVKGNFPFVYHLAALTSVRESIDNPDLYDLNNVMGTKKVLEKFPNAKIIYVSSAAVYGSHCAVPTPERINGIPENPYGESKKSAEQFVNTASRVRDQEVCIARPFNIYGPGQNPADEYSGVIPKFIKLKQEGKPLPLHGDGMQTRDFIHVNDVVEALILLMYHEGTYNIGTGHETYIRDIAHALEGKIKLVPKTSSGVQQSYADIFKLSELGFIPKHNVLDYVRSFK